MGRRKKKSGGSSPRQDQQGTSQPTQQSSQAVTEVKQNPQQLKQTDTQDNVQESKPQQKKEAIEKQSTDPKQQQSKQSQKAEGIEKQSIDSKQQQKKEAIEKQSTDSKQQQKKEGQEKEQSIKDDPIEQTTNPDGKTKAELKAERKAIQEAKMKTQLEAKKEEGGQGQKSKAELKAERRAKQEAQRAAKQKAAESGKADDNKTKEQQKKQIVKDNLRVSDNIQLDVEKTRKKIQRKLEKDQIPQRTVVEKKVGLFKHLHQYERDVSLTKDIPFSHSKIPPVILKLGLQYSEGIICGSNARCVALLGALSKVISDYRTPPQKELARDLEAKIKPYISFLTQCRPMSVSMGNAIKYLKHHISRIPAEMSETQAKKELFDHINDFLEEKIILAGQAISSIAQNKIQDNDVVMIYACSSLVRKVLCDAHDAGKKFKVVVVDSRPKLEGQEMLQRLIKHGINCSYVLINAVSFVMRQVTKVILGAHALLANGYVMSRVGNSQVALIAKSYNVPVLVCCETYKFCERVQTDSFVFNELGDPNDLVKTNKMESYLSEWKDVKKLGLLNLVYDVTPPELITVVISEMDMLPCTSVPVVLRVKHVETEKMS